MANLIVDAVPQSEVGIATGINTVMRTVGGSFGAAMATAILTASTQPLPTEGAYTTAFAFSAWPACSRSPPRGSCRARAGCASSPSPSDAVAPPAKSTRQGGGGRSIVLDRPWS